MSAVRALLLLALMATASPVLAEGTARDAAHAPTRQQVQAAAEVVRADPDLPGSRTTKTLRFKSDPENEETAPSRPDAGSDSLRWLIDVLEFVTEGARWLVWLLGAALLVWGLVRLRHWMRLRGVADAAERPAPPSHVGQLDIRPDSLPTDVGGAVAALWQRGQARAALSLLYRSALSRLAHGQGVPIRAASTEGECLALADQHLAAADHRFLTELVRAWQLTAYGGQLPQTTQVLSLCQHFDAHLRATPARIEGGPA